MGRPVRPAHPPDSGATVGIEDRTVVAGAGRVLPGAVTGARTVRIEDRAVLGPEDREELLKPGEEAGGGLPTLHGRENGILVVGAGR